MVYLASVLMLKNCTGKLHCTVVFHKVGMLRTCSTSHLAHLWPIMKFYSGTAGTYSSNAWLLSSRTLFILKSLWIRSCWLQVLMNIEVLVFIEAEMDISLGTHENHLFFTVRLLTPLLHVFLQVSTARHAHPDAQSWHWLCETLSSLPLKLFSWTMGLPLCFGAMPLSSYTACCSIGKSPNIQLQFSPSHSQVDFCHCTLSHFSMQDIFVHYIFSIAKKRTSGATAVFVSPCPHWLCW